MTAKDYLSQIQKLDVMIDNKILEIEQLRCLATKTTCVNEGDPVQTSGTSDKVGNCVTKIVSIQEEINVMIDQLVDMKKRIIRQIEQLDCNIYRVLFKRYVEYKALTKIAEELELSYQYIYELHGTALKEFSETYGNLEPICDIVII